jgi:hypothetical protein
MAKSPEISKNYLKSLVLEVYHFQNESDLTFSNQFIDWNSKSIEVTPNHVITFILRGDIYLIAMISSNFR